MKHREHMQGIEAASPVTIAGVEYTGAYLAMVVRMNPNLVGPESAETPQIIAEVGRIVALAKRAKDAAETRYRIWRDSTIHRLTNNIDEAIAAGFACASEPGVDSKGKPKPPKHPSVTVAETYMRGLAEYAEHQAIIAEREEAWATMHAVYEAAQARTWAARSVGEEHQKVGDNPRPRRVMNAPEGDNQNDRDLSEDPSMKTVSPATRRPPPPPPRRK